MSDKQKNIDRKRPLEGAQGKRKISAEEWAAKLIEDGHTKRFQLDHKKPKTSSSGGRYHEIASAVLNLGKKLKVCDDKRRALPKPEQCENIYTAHCEAAGRESFSKAVCSS